jgi:hypothetical protein
MIYDMAMASKISSFQSMQDDKIITKYVWMFGFKLLIDFIGLIWQLASLYLRFKR